MDDWREKLGAAFGIDAEAKAHEASTPAESDEPRDALEAQGKALLDIVLDRKGRKGKQATIIAGFKCDEAALKTLASELRHSLGTGGSARGGEILLQGDYRERALALLKERGFKARII